MNKLRKNGIYGLAFLIVGLGMLSAHPEPHKNAAHPHDMEKIMIRQDVTLDLKIPYGKILYGEIPHIYLGIKNGGNKPLKIDTEFGFDSDNQLIYEARGTDSKHNLTNVGFVPTWERLGKAVTQNQRGFEVLEKGASRVYLTQGKPNFPLSWNYDISPQGTQKIRVSLLTGENEWVFSDWVPLERLNERKLNESETIETILKGTGRSRMIKKAVIDGETYLFLANSTQIMH